MRIEYVTILLAIILMSFTQPKLDYSDEVLEGIRFQNGTFDDVLHKAEKENKLIFLDIYATWCGPCNKMKTKTFKNRAVGYFYNETFINFAIDGELGDGLTLAKKYRVRSYPTLLFLDFKGEIVSTYTGYHSPEELIDLGKKVNSRKR